MKRETEDRVSDLTLEQHRLGELDDAAAAAMTERIGRDPALRGRLEALERSDAEILAAHPPAEVAACIRGRLVRERRLKRIPVARMILPAAAAALLALTLFTVRDRLLAGTDDTRLKGLTTSLSAWRKVGEGAERLADGASARAGDVVQLSYLAGDARYGVILSIDGRGVVTFHLPEGWEGGPARSPALDRTGEITLASAYELDDAPSFERFFLVYGGDPFAVSAAADAARRLAAKPDSALRDRLGLPRGLQQVSFLLLKGR
jgi:hypothetical protein